MTSPLVAVVGDAALDISFAVESLEGVDEKLAATDSNRELGGTGANAAVTIARLGGRARLHAVVGRDPIGAILLEELQARGVDTTGVATADGHSTTAVVLRSADRRLVVVDRGVADTVSLLYPSAICAGAAVVYLSAMPWSLTADVVAASATSVVIGVEARQAAAIEGAGPPEATARILDRARVVVTNQAGAEAMAGILDRLTSAALVVTEGASGARLTEPGSPPVHVGAPTVDVVDATGAGDCFAGALCFSLAGGSSLDSAVRLATVAASLSVRGRGAQASLPTLAEVVERLPAD